MDTRLILSLVLHLNPVSTEMLIGLSNKTLVQVSKPPKFRNMQSVCAKWQERSGMVIAYMQLCILCTPQCIVNLLCYCVNCVESHKYCIATFLG